MNGSIRFLLKLGLMGSIFLVFLTFYQQYPTHQKREQIPQRQEMRKQLLRETCDKHRDTFLNGKQSLDDMSKGDLQHFVVDDKHRIIYCYIPKVACTNWKRVMFVLNLTKPYPDPMSISEDLVHELSKFTLLSSLPRIEIKEKLKNYTKFLFVRDPLVRLISAYRNKFVQRNEYFYNYFARDILHLYGNNPNPPQSVGEAFKAGVRPSFYNFIQYLLDPKTERRHPFEHHWRQQYRLCHPCLIQYDFVGHQETLDDDAEMLLKILKLENDITFPPSYENMTTNDLVFDWYKTVPLEDRKKLYNIYKADFQLFGYTVPHNLFDD